MRKRLLLSRRSARRHALLSTIIRECKSNPRGEALNLRNYSISRTRNLASSIRRLSSLNKNVSARSPTPRKLREKLLKPKKIEFALGNSLMTKRALGKPTLRKFRSTSANLSRRTLLMRRRMRAKCSDSALSRRSTLSITTRTCVSTCARLLSRSLSGPILIRSHSRHPSSAPSSRSHQTEVREPRSLSSRFTPRLAKSQKVKLCHQ